MKHARSDYDPIQDPRGKIPHDEPVFLLRGQDRNAARAVRFYAGLVAADPQGDPRVVVAALRHADAMDAWRLHKAPDIPSTAKIVAPQKVFAANARAIPRTDSEA